MKPSIFAVIFKIELMLVQDSPYYCNVINHKIVDIGNLYFFQNYLIAEINEGVNISFENFKESTELILAHFGDNHFGFIGNRVNSYSIVITDAREFNKAFKNLKAYATVTYNLFAENMLEVENHFFDFNKKNFTTLIEAVNWVEEIITSN